MIRKGLKIGAIALVVLVVLVVAAVAVVWQTRKPALLCPSPVAIHHNPDVLGKISELQLFGFQNWL